MTISAAKQGVADNAKQQAGKRLGGVTGKGFLPGRSGNPSGKPKEYSGFRDRCREFMERSGGGWAEIEKIARRAGKSITVRDQAFALRMIAEYAYGKPAQPVMGDGGVPLEIRVVYDGEAPVSAPDGLPHLPEGA